MISLIPLMIAGGFDGVEPMIRIALEPTNGRRMSYRAAARRLGCTQANVSMVVRGVRKSRSLLERMRKMNIRVEA